MDLPLVSINVLAYNASSFIVETLDSIKAQTYPNIELIVSDDASSDNTISVTQKWLDENGNRFNGVQLLVAESNQGVTASSNRALKASSGIYWKPIGSDDLLMPDAIEKFVGYMISHPESKIVFGNQITFTGDFKDKNFQKDKLLFRHLYFKDSTTALQQRKFQTRHFLGCAPASFGVVATLREVGGFDTRYPMNEDGPLYKRLTSHGYKLHYLDEYVVYRRVHEGSIMHQKHTDALMGNNMVQNLLHPVVDIDEYVSVFWKAMGRFSRWLGIMVIKTGNTRQSFICRLCNFNRRWLNPYKWSLMWEMLKDKIANKLAHDEV